QHGAARPTGNAQLAPAPADGVFPDGFYSTTNLESFLRVRDRWIPVEAIEMDCGILVSESAGEVSARCIPMLHVRKSDVIVVGDEGVRVKPPPRQDPKDLFSFMGSDVSSERPKELVVDAVVQGMKETRESGRQVLFVGGPAIVHTGAGPWLEAIILAGWIDVLFAGNAL